MNIHVANPLKTGWLLKKGEKRKNWKRRWCVLDRTGKNMHYFNSNEDEAKLLGVIFIGPASKIEFTDLFKKEKVLMIDSGTDRVYYLQGEKEEDIESWHRTILKAIGRADELKDSVDKTKSKDEVSTEKSKKSKKSDWEERKEGEKTYYFNTVTSETTNTLPLSTWKKCLDKKSGKTYYYNVVSKETTWKLNIGENGEVISKKSKKRSKEVDENVKETPTEKSEAGKVTSSDREKKPTAVSKSKEKTSSNTTPERPDLQDYPGWKAKYDQRKEKFYFYNKSEGVTTWKHPERYLAKIKQEKVKEVRNRDSKSSNEEQAPVSAPKKDVYAKSGAGAEPQKTKEFDVEAKKPEPQAEPVRESKREAEKKTENKSKSASEREADTEKNATPEISSGKEALEKSPQNHAKKAEMSVGPNTEEEIRKEKDQAILDTPLSELVKGKNPPPPPPSRSKKTSEVNIAGKGPPPPPPSRSKKTFEGNGAGKEPPIKEKNVANELLDWKEAFDEKSQRKYYFNTLTKETSWDLLNLASESSAEGGNDELKKAAARAAEAVDGSRASEDTKSQDWKEAVDPKSGRKYFYNELTGKTRWADEKPVAGASGKAKEKEQETTKSEGSAKASSIKLDPKEWTKVRTSSGTYLVNAFTGERVAEEDMMAGKVRVFDSKEWTKMRTDTGVVMVNAFTGERVAAYNDGDQKSRTQEKPPSTSSQPTVKPSKWRTQHDMKTGKKYYSNVETREVAWVLPQGAVLVDSTAGSPLKPSFGAAPATLSGTGKSGAGTSPVSIPQKMGWLTKEGGNWKTWRRRYFVLEDFILTYYKEPKSPQLGKFIVPSYKCVKGKTKGKKFYFDLCHPNVRTYKFYADSESERQGWIDAFESHGLATGTAMEVSEDVRAAKDSGIKIVHPEESKAREAYKSNVKITSLSHLDKASSSSALAKRSSRIFVSSSPKSELSTKNQDIKLASSPIAKERQSVGAEKPVAKESASTKKEDDWKPVPGWERTFSKEHGRYYYYNKETKETAWLPPTLPKSSEVDQKEESEVKKEPVDEREPLDVRTLAMVLTGLCDEMEWAEEDAIEAASHVLSLLSQRRLPEDEDELVDLLEEAAEYEDGRNIVNLDKAEERMERLRRQMREAMKAVHEIVSDKQSLSWQSRDQTSNHVDVLSQLCKLIEGGENAEEIELEGDTLVHDLADWFVVEVERLEQQEAQMEVKSMLIKALGMVVMQEERFSEIAINFDVPKWLVHFLMSRYEIALAEGEDEKNEFLAGEIFFYGTSLLTILFSQGQRIPIHAKKALLEAGMVEFFLSIIEYVKDIESQISRSAFFCISSYNLCFHDKDDEDDGYGRKDNDVARILVKTLNKEAHEFGELFLVIANGEEPVGDDSVVKLLNDLSLYDYDEGVSDSDDESEDEEEVENEEKHQPFAFSFLYITDSDVLVDIVMRNLTDLDELSERRAFYLRILFGILKNPEYSAWRVREIMDTLQTYRDGLFEVLDVDIELSKALLEQFGNKFM